MSCSTCRDLSTFSKPSFESATSFHRKSKTNVEASHVSFLRDSTWTSIPIEKPNIWCCNVCRNSKLAHIGFTSKMSLLDLQKMMETIRIYKRDGRFQGCCVAATMCASQRKMMLRSTDHVCKCKERYHPPPHPTRPCGSPGNLPSLGSYDILDPSEIRPSQTNSPKLRSPWNSTKRAPGSSYYLCDISSSSGPTWKFTSPVDHQHMDICFTSLVLWVTWELMSLMHSYNAKCVLMRFWCWDSAEHPTKIPDTILIQTNFAWKWQFDQKTFRLVPRNQFHTLEYLHESPKV